MAVVDLQRVKAIFAAASDKDGPDRLAYLDRACGGNAALRREVEAYLSAAGRADGFLDRPTADAPPAPRPCPHADATADVVVAGVLPGRAAGGAAAVREGPGSRIGRYKLLQPIGEGGFGTVYMAEQQEPVRRRVALKVIKLGMDTRQVIARFEAERQALAMMDHPNIARVLDAGATEAGRPYFVMELVRGVPVTDYCDAQGLTARERLELFEQVCRAVQHAHQKGIIHRDIKPSNILVTIADGAPIPKVIDFGIAKATDQRLTEKTLFTEFRQMIGTPQYMSPEQAEMAGIDIDTRSDVYSLGVLLYELLTGTTPFDARELRSAGYGEMQRIIREVEPPRPSTRLSTMGDGLASVAAHRRTEPAKLRRVVRGELDWIVMRCLEKDRTRRYDTANGLAQDVERYLADEPVAARRATAGYRLYKFARRHKVGAAAALSIAAALVLAVVGTTIGMVRANAARHNAAAAEGEATREKENALKLLGEVQRAKADADRQARRAMSANDYLQNMFRAARLPGKGGGGLDVKLVDVLGQAAGRLDDLQDQPEVELDLRLALARAFESLGQNAEAYKHYTRALILSRAINGPESPQTLQVMADGILSQANDLQGDEPTAVEVVDTARRVLGENDPVTIDALNVLAAVLIRDQRYSESEALFRDLIRRTRPPAAGPSTPASKSPAGLRGRARFYSGLSKVLNMSNRQAEAEAVAREEIQIARAEQESGVKRPGPGRRNLAQALANQNQLAEAEALIREDYEYDKQALGPSHPDTKEAKGVLVSILEQRGAYAEALPLVREDLARLRRFDFGITVYSQYVVGEMLMWTGRDAEARAAFDALLAEGWTWVESEKGQQMGMMYLVQGCWSRASMAFGLRADRPWAGPGVRSAVTRAAWTALDRRGSPGVTLDEIDWAAARFQLSRWYGDPATADPPGPRGLRAVAEGGREAIWATKDPEPGIYLVSATLPRCHGRPYRATVWAWFAPWDVSYYLPLPGAGAAGPATTAPTIAPTTSPPDAPVFPNAPPLGPLAERRTEPSLDFERWWFMNYGFGPARKPYGFTVSARATVLPPPGHYLLRVEADGVSRESLDGNVLTAVRQNGTVRTTDIDATDGKAGAFQLDWQATGDAWVVTLEPTGKAAEAARKAVQDPMGDLEAEVDRLTSALGPKGPDQAETLLNRAKALVRLGLFDDAARDFRKMIELDATQSYPAYIYASVLAWRGDRDGCRALTRDMVARFGGGPRPEWREHACKAAALLPGLVDDPSGLPGMADAGLAASPPKALVPWLKMAKVMAEYRAGHDEAAADAGTEAVAAMAPMKGAGLARAACHYFRAMALRRLGRADDSKAAYDEAEREVAASDRVPGKDDLGDGAENWLVCHVVRREAQAMFGKTPTTLPATKPAAGGG